MGDPLDTIFSKLFTEHRKYVFFNSDFSVFSMLMCIVNLSGNISFSGFLNLAENKTFSFMGFIIILVFYLCFGEDRHVNSETVGFIPLLP